MMEKNSSYWLLKMCTDSANLHFPLWLNIYYNTTSITFLRYSYYIVHGSSSSKCMLADCLPVLIVLVVTDQDVCVLLLQVRQRTVSTLQTHQQTSKRDVNSHLIVVLALFELVDGTEHDIVVVVSQRTVASLWRSPGTVRSDHGILVTQRRSQCDGQRVAFLDWEQLAVDVQGDLDVLGRRRLALNAADLVVPSIVDRVDVEHIFKQDPGHGDDVGGY